MDYNESLENLSELLLFNAKLGLPQNSPYILKALKLVKNKGVPLSHVFAELLLCKYFSERKFLCDIEMTINNMKCDVYIEKGFIDVCVEVMYYNIPIENIGEWKRAIIVTHLKKVLNASKSNIKFIAFAYPYGLIPLVPPEIIGSISKDILINTLLKYGLTYEATEVENLNHITPIYAFYIFDFSEMKVYEILPDHAKTLLLFYTSVIDKRNCSISKTQ